MGDLGAAVTVGGGLGVGVDLDGLELLGNPCSWAEEVARERERRGRVRQLNRKWMRYHQFIPGVGKKQKLQGEFSDTGS